MIGLSGEYGEGDFTGMLVLTLAAGVREFIKSSTNKTTSGMTVNKTINMAPSRVKRKYVCEPSVWKKKRE
jgi:hypothetical protein